MRQLMKRKCNCEAGCGSCGNSSEAVRLAARLAVPTHIQTNTDIMCTQNELEYPVGKRRAHSYPICSAKNYCYTSGFAFFWKILMSFLLLLHDNQILFFTGRPPYLHFPVGISGYSSARAVFTPIALLVLRGTIRGICD